MKNQYHVFLSYALVDNTPLARPWKISDTEQIVNWVNCFKVALQGALDRRFGRIANSAIFIDQAEIRTGDNLDATIRTALDRTNIFLCLVSRGSVHDDSWCKMEREYFLKRMGKEANTAGRVFGVLLDEDSLGLWKEHFIPNVRAFPFFVKNSVTDTCVRLGNGEIDAPFIDRITTLASDIADAIEKLAPSLDDGAAGTAGTRPSEPKGVVFLTATPGDIDEERSELFDAIQEAGWRVIPERNECPCDLTECKAWAKQLASQADVVIQVLSRFPWKPFPCDAAQFEGATAVAQEDKQKLIWRFVAGDQPVSQIKNEQHRKWVESNDTRHHSIPALKGEILKNLNERLAQKEAGGRDYTDHASSFISIRTPKGEEAIGEQLMTDLEKLGLYPSIPSLLSLEHCLLNEHGFLAIYGNEPYVGENGIERILLDWRGYLMKHLGQLGGAPPCGVYLTQPPPADKKIRIAAPGLRMIPWNDPGKLNGFAREVAAYSARAQNRQAPNPTGK